MPNRFRETAKISREKTNEELRDEIAKLTTLNLEKINSLLPQKADKERMIELMDIVHSAAAANKKVADLGRNIQKLGPVIIKILKAVV